VCVCVVCVCVYVCVCVCGGDRCEWALVRGAAGVIGFCFTVL
jgi:hypothetical protein